MMVKCLIAKCAYNLCQATFALMRQAWMLNSLRNWRQWHGVGQLPVIDEAQHQMVLNDGILQSIVVPCEQVDGTPLTALDILPPQVTADGVQVLKTYCFILSHR